jgi:Ca-activated chloride channel family protein
VQAGAALPEHRVMRSFISACLFSLAACGGMRSPGHYAMSAPRPMSMAVAGPITDTATSGDTHQDAGKNPWVETARDPLSTFAADVDTAAYTYARRALIGGALPDAASVRVEEYVNYFKYAFPAPADDAPFAVIMDAAPSPLVPDHHLVRVAVATPVVAAAARKPANLVFLVDVSGSMDDPSKLPLARRALALLVDQLRPTDRVALVTYAGSTGVVLPSTTVAHKDQILRAIEHLSAGGSTAMASGLELAYAEAAKGDSGETNSRVIVMTDGDANVGPSDPGALLALIRGRVEAGITISTIGFGMGNYRDDLMEQLADHGNGNNYYIDSDQAAQRLFGADLAAMLEVAAKDVKLQVAFDPAQVARYRLIGYENRAIADADFRKDEVDAGEIGVGHQVTAIFEVQLTEAGRATPAPLGQVNIRWKTPRGQVASERSYAMAGPPVASFAAASDDLRFAIAVAAFADVLRNAEDAGRWSLADIAQVARAAAHGDRDRLELVDLVERAGRLRAPTASVAAER